MASQAQKRSASAQHSLLDGVKAVLLDIDGTTTPISFVHDKLCGYVRDNLKEYIATRFENEEIQGIIDALSKQAASDTEAKVEGVVEIVGKDDKDKCVQSIVDNVLWQMDEDRKNSSLKQLQGHMWREAFKTDKVQGEVFEDVVDGLKALTKAEKQVFVFSTSSVETQKLLFGYSDKGDLQEYFAGFFDTSVGAKTETDSYKAVVGEMDVQASDVLYLTDVAREAAPAAEAGLKVCLVEREGNTALTDDEKAKYGTIKSFAELFATEEDDEPPAKRTAPEGAEESNGAAEEEDDDLDDDELVEGEDDDGVDEEEEAAEEAS